MTSSIEDNSEENFEALSVEKPVKFRFIKNLWTSLRAPSFDGVNSARNNGARAYAVFIFVLILSFVAGYLIYRIQKPLIFFGRPSSNLTSLLVEKSAINKVKLKRVENGKATLMLNNGQYFSVNLTTRDPNKVRPDLKTNYYLLFRKRWNNTFSSYVYEIIDPFAVDIKELEGKDLNLDSYIALHTYEDTPGDKVYYGRIYIIEDTK